VVLSIAALASAAASSLANPITFVASQGNRAASVTFDTVGTDLQVNLLNTSTFDVLVPADVLTAVFFDIGGPSPSLTRTSALLGSGTTVLFGPQPAGGVVGGEWAYRAGLSGAPQGAAYGISSSGLNLFGPSDLFPGPNLAGPVSPNGLEFGILSAGDNPGTGNSEVTGGDGPMIKNEVVFRLSGLPVGFDPAASIRNVSFQYGTALTEPNIPAPGTMALLALGAGLAFRRRR
jgi:uncharacterized protein (TIGR03382 family)